MINNYLVLLVGLLFIWVIMQRNKVDEGYKYQSYYHKTHDEHRERDCDMCNDVNVDKYTEGKVPRDLVSLYQKDECGRCRGCIKYNNIYKPCSKGYTRSTVHPELLCVKRMCDGQSPEVNVNDNKVADYNRDTDYSEYAEETQNIDDY